MSGQSTNKGESAVGLAKLEFIAGKKSLFLIFDRDGTLVPFSDAPALAIMDPALKRTLQEFSARLNTDVAIVSARGLNSLATEFEANSFILAGNYGLEISFPCGKRFLHSAAASVLSQMNELDALLSSLTALRPGLILDRHKYSLCLHFHKLPEHERDRLHLGIQDLSQVFSTFICRRQATSYEFLPPCKWDKSNALEEILEQFSFCDDEMPFCLAFGDSDADEAMYSWVNKHKGMSFNIGKRSSRSATVNLDSPKELSIMLKELLELIRAKPQSNFE